VGTPRTSASTSARTWGVLLTELTVGQVQAMFTAIIRQHQALGTPVSAATLSRIRATLRAALNAAIRRGLITDNPAARAEPPRARRPRAVVWAPYRVGQWRRSGNGPVAVWTAAQTAKFLDSVRWHRLYAANHLIALRGLRRGEAAGLRWCDVDLDGKTAVISQQLQQYDGRLGVVPAQDAAQCSRDRHGPDNHRGAGRAPGQAARRGRRLRSWLPRQRVGVHPPERGPDGAASVGAPGARRGQGNPRQTCALWGAPGEVYVAARINDIHGA
jgi:integrase